MGLGCCPIEETKSYRLCLHSLHSCAKLTHKIAAALKISAQQWHGKKNHDFQENLENEKIAKNIEKIDKNR